ncbi:hypothetical protein [Streptomyces sp. PvR034]|uniref:VMAP-C domain-containing protein n=1 Tax=Streptomyces sp. PvR034 TaxID=3156401 RepID=UPI00339B02A4
MEREPVASGAARTAFWRGIDRLLSGARTSAALPAALTELRSRLAADDPEAHWAEGLALLYDDPTRPLPGPESLVDPS